MPERVANKWICVLVAALGCGLAFAGTGRADNAQPTLTTATPGLASPAFSAATVNSSSSPDVQSFSVLGSGTQAVSFVYHGWSAFCNNTLQVFTVDNPAGSIGGTYPGNAAWPAAVDGRSPQSLFVTNDPAGSTKTLDFQAGAILAFRLIGCDGDYFYSFTAANFDNFDHLLTYPDSSGQSWELSWEDQPYGGDLSYANFIVDVSPVQDSTQAPPPPGDTASPTVELTAPADGAEVSQTIPVTATASDDVAVAGVQFQLDGQNLGNEVRSSPYSVPWDTTTADDGNHTLTAIAYDTAGNASAPASLQVLVANNVLDGTGDDTPAATFTADIQPKTGGCGGAASTTDMAATDAVSAACTASSWCSSKNETVSMIQTMDSQPIEYHNRITHLTYWRARASVLVCENTRKGVITDFKESSATVTPLYALHVGPIPVWHYDNRARWTFGATGSKATTSTAQVTDSFTGCPFGLPIGCNTVTFTVQFELNGNGTYRYSLSYQGA